VENCVLLLFSRCAAPFLSFQSPPALTTMAVNRPIPPAPPAALVNALRAAKVPIEDLSAAQDACNGCSDHEEDEGELGWPKGCVILLPFTFRARADRIPMRLHQFRDGQRVADAGRSDCVQPVRFPLYPLLRSAS
jgi:hypothetical protein